MSGIEALLADARAGGRNALARLLSIAERGGAEADWLDASLAGCTGAAHSVGITGAPGAGKSTLTAELARSARADMARVAILAVDPSSPLTHGAILGDRVRMHRLAADEGVFVRSMASRGSQGGLAGASAAALRVFDACAWPLILVETVGIGQVEVEISAATDTVVVVLNPGWGDEIQANKAGLMEVADIFVINKADREGAAQTRRDLESALLASPGARALPILETVATEGRGVEALWKEIRAHAECLRESGELARRRARRQHAELERVLLERLRGRLRELLADPRHLELREALARGEIGVVAAAERLLDGL